MSVSMDGCMDAWMYVWMHGCKWKQPRKSRRWLKTPMEPTPTIWLPIKDYVIPGISRFKGHFYMMSISSSSSSLSSYVTVAQVISMHREIGFLDGLNLSALPQMFTHSFPTFQLTYTVSKSKQISPCYMFY